MTAPLKSFVVRLNNGAEVKKNIQDGKGELFLNATDVANTMRIKREIKGDRFIFISNDYYETQVIRVGYNYKF